jgi:large subunit ribosomal protein L10
MTTVARHYPTRKVEQLRKLISLSEKYHVIALAKLTKVRSTQIMEMRKSMRGQLELLVVKNKIAVKGLNQVGKPSLNNLANSIKGQYLYIFTDMNPFKLNLMLEKNKVLLPAKAGDIATDTIIIPAGNTGLAPGPVLSEFKDCKVITKIEGGSIWVTKDTMVAQPGDVITPRLASLLSKLNIRPIKAGLTLDLVYWDGLILTSKDIHIDIVQFTSDFIFASRNAFNLAVNSGYPADKEVTTVLVVQSLAKALNLALKSNYMTKDTAELILKDAELQAYKILELTKQKGFST